MEDKAEKDSERTEVSSNEPAPDLLEVKGGKKDKHHKWVNKHPLTLAKAKVKGYVAVTEGEVEEAGSSKGGGGHYEHIDTVLMSVGKQSVLDRQARMQRRADEALKGLRARGERAIERVKEAAERLRRGEKQDLEELDAEVDEIMKKEE